jgi:succinate dehydrogenase hydrophobic anchor subunit
MKTFTSGFLHWILQRKSAIFLIFSGLSLILLINSVFLNCLVLTVVVYHFKLGFETLIEDYTHNHTFKVLGFAQLRLVVIYLVKFTFLLIIL